MPPILYCPLIVAFFAHPHPLETMDSILARSFTGFPCLQEIRAFLASGTESFQKSELYSSSVDAKIIDESLRKSKFRTFKDGELFSLVDNIVGWLNTSDPTFIYQLRRDNVTETRYEAGGHFLKHKASMIGLSFIRLMVLP